MDPAAVVRYAVTAVGGILIALMVARVYSPWARRRPGEERQKLRVGLTQRLLVHRFYAMAVLGLFLIPRLVPEGPWFLLGADLAALLILASVLLFPLRYYFTDVGFVLQSGRFYRWNEFGSYRRAGSVVELRPHERGRAISLYLSEPQQQAILPLLRRYIAQASRAN
ncbi:MAG: hypothetical protein FJ029_05310 [Actinobacteria bacterium]|nr:hypothetical protein [Actinomycetota bacterium]